MKKFLIQLLFFLLFFAGVDCVLGELLHVGEAHAIGGKTERNYYIINKTNDNILVFGSSRALNHYSPKVFEKELHETMYNCGEDETGIICFYPKLNLIKQRYSPKRIIYDIYSADLLDSLRFQNADYLKTLKTSYGCTEAIDSMFSRYDASSTIKMISKLYQYNSTFFSVFLDNIRKTDYYEKGFYTMNDGMLKTEPFVDNLHKEYSYDKEKLRLLEQFIIDNKETIHLYFCISPEYGRTNDEMFQPIKDLCLKYNIPLLNHYCDTTFTRHKELFMNQNHLNLRGATIYSTLISKEISKYENDIQ